MDEEEVEFFGRTANAFSAYLQTVNDAILEPRQARLNALSASQASVAGQVLHSWLTDLSRHFHVNQSVASAIARTGYAMTLAHSGLPNINFEDPKFAPSQFDEESALSTFKQIAREWSIVGTVEREQSFGPVLEDLAHRFPDEASRSHKLVVCPGSGLGRLPYEIARMGFNSHGNEFSPHMIFTSQYILNSLETANAATVYPFVHSFSGAADSSTMTLPVDFPDVSPHELESNGAPGGQMSMAVGDFVGSYKDSGSVDVVVTMFFLDTSPNVVQTVEEISRIVPTGGLWINFGPLLWHFDRQRPLQSGELLGGLDMTQADLFELIPRYGWRIEKRQSVKTTYCHNPRSLLRYEYTCEYFVAVKE